MLHPPIFDSGLPISILSLTITEHHRFLEFMFTGE